MDWAIRLQGLAATADALVDISRVLTAERGDHATDDVLVWALAVRGAIATHERDLGAMPPGSRLAALLADLSRAYPQFLPAIEPLLGAALSPAGVAHQCDVALAALTTGRSGGLGDGPIDGDEIARIDEIIGMLAAAAAASRMLVGRLSALADTTKALFDAMEFGFLFDPGRRIFSIGYRVVDGGLDPSAYDLLASEARLASFVAIAKGDVPASHWFHLGRAMTPVGLGSALVSWSGSMFEYLMPALVMDSPPGACSGRRTASWWTVRSATERSAASPGASPNRPTTSATWI